MATLMKFTLVIPVMRKLTLGRSLQYYADLAPDLIERVVVIDYDYVFSQHHGLYKLLEKVPHLKVVIEGETYFNKSRAINLGVALSEARHVIVCDADVLIDVETISSWAQTFLDRPSAELALMPDQMVETADGRTRAAPGIVAFMAQSFIAVEGYSSEFIGWGFEDRDFLWRLDRAGIRVINMGSAAHISHGESERTQNYPPADGGGGPVDALTARLKMRERNLLLFAARKEKQVATGSLFEDLARYGLEGHRRGHAANGSHDPGRFCVVGAGAGLSPTGANLIKLTRRRKAAQSAT
jgi:hypothetical protein